VTIDQLDTPAILVDVDRVERNIAGMMEKAEVAGVGLRPHFKTSKLLEVSRMQRTAGAIGMTCATDRELEVLQDDGVESIVWGHQAVGRSKLDLAVSANRRGEVILAVDSVEVAAALSDRAARDGTTVPCFIEVDTGMRRCGVQPEEVVGLALALREMAGVSVVGLMTHEGHLHGHLDDPEGLVASAREAARSVVLAREECIAAGLPIDVVSVGSTPAASVAPLERGVTEMRPGTYVFFDANQVALGTASWQHCAVTVLARVVSHNRDGMAVVDAGLKELSGDGSIRGRGHGHVVDLGATVIHAYEEHGVIDRCATPPSIGDLVRIVPNHVCGAVNMWSSVAAVRGERVVGEWRTRGRR
jgi:D-serine deaminase-like pyridoxal phosphate-dependent protein